MNSFSIAVAQICSIKGDIESNIKAHTELIKIAYQYKADIIIFPELSLSGYEPEIAKEIMITAEDNRLIPLKEVAKKLSMTIVAGAPVDSLKSKPYIGAIILKDDKSSIYIKNHLHPGEEIYFSEGDKKSTVISIKDQHIGIAICADVNHASHASNAASNGATIYAAGVLMMDGYNKAVQQLQQYAIEHSMIVAMSNYGAPTGGYVPAGKSAIWDQKGKLLAIAPDSGNAVVIGTKKQNCWTGLTIKCN